MSEKCKSCGAPIRWERTHNGKLTPLDAEPNPDGNTTIQDGIAYVIPKGELFDGVRYMTHWATCPNSKAHKKGDGRV